MQFSIEYIGNLFYIVTIVLGTMLLLWGHHTKAINLWECIRSTDRSGVIRTDRRKLFEVTMFYVMTISFYYFSVTKQLTDTFVGMYAATALGAAMWRDREKRLARSDQPEGEVETKGKGKK